VEEEISWRQKKEETVSKHHFSPFGSWTDSKDDHRRNKVWAVEI
jgi:hypothetical protein